MDAASSYDVGLIRTFMAVFPFDAGAEPLVRRQIYSPVQRCSTHGTLWS